MLRTKKNNVTLSSVRDIYAVAQPTNTPLKHDSVLRQSVTAKEQKILVTLEETFKASLDGHYAILPELVILASKLGHVATVERYIAEHRATLTVEDQRLYTQAMWWAIEQRPRNIHHDQIFWLLLNAGADIDAGVDCYETPLIWAIRHQNKTKFDVLLSRGAKVTIGDPLWVAASGSSYFVNVLLKKGIHDPVKLTVALRRAAASNRANNVSLMLCALSTVMNDCNAEMIDAAIADAFHAAAASNSASSVKAFLKFGINVNTRDKSGHTVLATAAFHGQTELVELLLKNGADVNATSYAGISTLMMAVVGRNRFTVGVLIDVEGVRLDVRNARGYTAAELASARGYHFIASMIEYAVKSKQASPTSSSANSSVRFFSHSVTQSNEQASVPLRLI